MPHIEIAQLKRDSKKEGAIQAKCNLLTLYSIRLRQLMELINQYRFIIKQKKGDQWSDYHDSRKTNSDVINDYRSNFGVVKLQLENVQSRCQALYEELKLFLETMNPGAEQRSAILYHISIYLRFLNKHSVAITYLLKVDKESSVFPKALLELCRIKEYDSRLSPVEANRIHRFLTSKGIPYLEKYYFNDSKTSNKRKMMEIFSTAVKLYTLMNDITKAMAYKPIVMRLATLHDVLDPISAEMRYKRLRMKYEQYYQTKTVVALESYKESITTRTATKDAYVVNRYESLMKEYQQLLKHEELTHTLKLKVQTMRMRIYLLLAFHTEDKEYLTLASGLSNSVLNDCVFNGMNKKLSIFKLIQADLSESCSELSVQSRAHKLFREAGLDRDYEPKHSRALTASLFSKKSDAERQLMLARPRNTMSYDYIRATTRYWKSRPTFAFAAQDDLDTRLSLHILPLNILMSLFMRHDDTLEKLSKFITILLLGNLELRHSAYTYSIKRRGKHGFLNVKNSTDTLDARGIHDGDTLQCFVDTRPQNTK